MAVSENVSKRTCAVVLSRGTTPSGTVQTTNVSIGTLDKDAWDAEKAMAIANLLEPCFALTRLKVQATKIDDLVLES